MDKSYYRDLFQELKPFIKFSTFCRMINLNPSTLSLFMRSPEYDYMISDETLGRLESAIHEFLDNFA